MEWSDITEGMMIGIGVSIVTGIAVLAREFMKKRQEKEYLRKILRSQLQAIINASDITTPNGQQILADQTRRAIFDELYRDIQEILNTGSSRIDFEDKIKIRKVFRTINWTFSAGGHPRLPNQQVYQNILVQGLKEISWLGIS